MCQNCEDNERERLTDIAMQNRRPCLVCKDRNVAGVGTWRPDASTRLAAGGNDKQDVIFAFWLCDVHAEPTHKNEKLIKQTILREVRSGNSYRV